MTSNKNTIIAVNTSSGYFRPLVLMGVFFFIFGFVTWTNGTLIPYLRIACQLQEWEAYLVTFSFYIAYTVMALPSSNLFRYTGMIGGMRFGLMIMAFGCLCFVPAALTREYFIFLLALFIVGTGLTILQTAVNPYVTLLGPPDSAARRMSVMGICNKFAGVIAPIILGAIILSDAQGLVKELENLRGIQLKMRLDELARSVILPYCILAVILFVLGWLIRFARLPELGNTTEIQEATHAQSLPAKDYSKRLLTGFIAIFCTVGAEVVAGDTIANYGIYHGINLNTAKMLTSYTLAAMMTGFLLGALVIPKYLSQDRAFRVSNILGLCLLIGVLFLPGKVSVYFVSLLGFANALLWPAIWPQALRNLRGKQLHKASAVLIMGIAGGAVVPLIYGWITTVFNNQLAYTILAPLYLYNLWYTFYARNYD